MATHGAAVAPAISDSTKLSVERTRLSHERTLMSWLRTATSLISFGFTVYKFFDYLREQGGGRPPERLVGPREFALGMIGLGMVSLLFATMQHQRSLKLLREHYGAGPYSEAAVLAGLISVLGLVAFLAVVFRQ